MSRKSTQILTGAIDRELQPFSGPVSIPAVALRLSEKYAEDQSLRRAYRSERYIEVDEEIPNFDQRFRRRIEQNERAINSALDAILKEDEMLLYSDEGKIQVRATLVELHGERWIGTKRDPYSGEWVEADRFKNIMYAEQFEDKRINQQTSVTVDQQAQKRTSRLQSLFPSSKKATAPSTL